MEAEVGPEDIVWKSGREKEFDGRTAEKGKKVIAVEKDEQLAELLRTKLCDPPATLCVAREAGRVLTKSVFIGGGER